jgi:hypothetical protein
MAIICHGAECQGSVSGTHPASQGRSRLTRALFGARWWPAMSRRPRAILGRPRRMFVLSRVTNGADVAVVSVLLATAMR